MLTAGQYAFLWGFRLAREVGEMSPTPFIPVRAHARSFAIGYVLHLGATVGLFRQAWSGGPQSVSHGLFWCGYLLGLALLVHFIWLLTQVAKRLRSLSGSASPETFQVVMLTLILSTSLPWLQSHVNKRV